MKYNGKELKEFTSEKPIAFDLPKRMLVWDNTYDGPIETDVLAYLPGLMCPVITEPARYTHCAEIPETPKAKRATNRELIRWLAKGHGEILYENTNIVAVGYSYRLGHHFDPVPARHLIRKWGDADWHQPTVDYMGIK